MQALQGERSRERFGFGFPAVHSRAYLARALAERGVFDEGEAHGQEAIRMAERSISRIASSGHVWGSRISTASGEN